MNILIKEAIEKQFLLQDFIPLFKGKFELLEKLKDTIQDKGWHSEGDVEIHTNMVLLETYKIIKSEQLTEQESKILVLSALLHDICKPITTKEREKDGVIRVVAPKHEIYGRNNIIFDLLELELDHYEIMSIANLVGYHNLPKLAVVKDDSIQNYKQIARLANIKLLYYLELADMRGRECSDKKEGIENIELFKLMADDYESFNLEPYQHEIDFVNNLDFNKQQKNFVLGSFKRDYENKNIFMIEETIAKMYDQVSNYSHLIILCGIAGSGKSTIAQQYENDGYHILSLDSLREDKNIDDKQIRSIMKDSLKKLLASKSNVVIDATNYRRDFRDVYTSLGFNYGAFVEIKTILTSKKNILKNNKSRQRNVDDKVIENQIKKFELPELTEAHFVSYIMEQ